MKNEHYRMSDNKDPLPFINSWQLWEKRGDYCIWTRGTADYQILWNVTKSDMEPPLTAGGYYNRDYLLKVKGIQ